ncbi:hypothetical protein, partial [Pseudomonas aeruginosa]
MASFNETCSILRRKAHNYSERGIDHGEL